MSRRALVVPRLTKKAIDELAFKWGPGSKRPHRVPDHEVPRLYVRVYPGSPICPKKFVVRYYVDGRQREETLGTYGIITLDRAREMARARLAAADTGQPMPSRRQAGVTGAGLRFDTLVEQYLRDHVAHVRSGPEIERVIRKHMLPIWGSRSALSITVQDVLDVRTSMSKTPALANRVRTVVRAMYHWASRLELIPADHRNPARGVPKFPELSRTRVLTMEELRALFAAIDELASPQTGALLMLLACVPFRRGEGMRLKWEGFDPVGGTVCVDALSEGKSSSPQWVPPDVIQRIQALPRYEGCPWVFPNGDRTNHVSDINDTWHRVRARAGIPDVRLHDLRRTIATDYARQGASGFEIQQYLGHRSAKTSEPYVRLGNAAGMAKKRGEVRMKALAEGAADAAER